MPRLDATRVSAWRELQSVVTDVTRRIDDDLRTEWAVPLGWFDVLAALRELGGMARPQDLAAAMLASTLGIEFDEEKSWDEKKEVWKISGKIYRSFNITQSAIVKDEYATVIAAAVFVI